MTRLWCNGQWLDPLDFSPAPTDRGLMHGFGLFETILAIDGRPVFADRHLERFRVCCERLGWRPGHVVTEETIIELIAANELGAGRARVRLAITGGSGVLQELLLGDDHVIWMTVSPLAEPPESASANLSPWARNEKSALVGLKCASYAENVVALSHAVGEGYKETIFLNTAARVCEAATSNVFLVKDGVVRTPSLASGCLPGITRGTVIGLAASHGISCEETDLRAEDLREADEIFLTSSIRGVMGVSRFIERQLPVGPVTVKLRDAWLADVKRSLAG